MRERPRGHGYKPGERWPALERPTWDPLMRALVIDTATVNLHRKLRRMAGDTGLYAFAVLCDCAVFAAPAPGALDVLTGPDGTLTTSLRLGVSPGHVEKMPGGVAQRLYVARDAGAGQDEQERILAEGLREHDFKDDGRRARGLDVELNDIAWMDVEL
ncbi:hypothetical protein [Kitasatospora cinereorecta]|uniref:Uncharacterized protein n=1 Tax=Kitasatospora cinereorecta TaxID=285560 RepID=A0ABW0VK87_9ACTN